METVPRFEPGEANRAKLSELERRVVVMVDPAQAVTVGTPAGFWTMYCALGRDQQAGWEMGLW